MTRAIAARDGGCHRDGGGAAAATEGGAAAARESPTRRLRHRRRGKAVDAAQRRTSDDDHQQEKDKNFGKWTDDEHERFLRGLELHGRKWSKIANFVQSRSSVQVRTHAQKYFLGYPKPRKEGSSMAAALGLTRLRDSSTRSPSSTAVFTRTSNATAVATQTVAKIGEHDGGPPPIGARRRARVPQRTSRGDALADARADRGQIPDVRC